MLNYQFTTIFFSKRAGLLVLLVDGIDIDNDGSDNGDNRDDNETLIKKALHEQ